MEAVAGQTDALLDGPWVPVCVGGTQLLAKSWFGPVSYRVMLTDLQNVWEEQMCLEAIRSRATELNRRLRASAEAFCSHLRQTALPWLSGDTAPPNGEGGASEAQLSLLRQADGRLDLRLRSQLAGLPFYWEFHCHPAPVTLVCQQLVRPLLLMSRLLQLQVERLGDLLRSKDTEIQEYRDNGATLSRERLQTEVFEEQRYRESFINQTIPQLCRGPQDGLGFNADLSSLYIALVSQGNAHKRKLSEGQDTTGDEAVGPGPDTDQTVGQAPPPGSEPPPRESPQSQGEETDKMADSTRGKQVAPPSSGCLPSRTKKKKAVGLFR